MKHIQSILWVGIALLVLSSCNLSKEERAISGSWKQNALLFKSVKHFKADKTFESLFYLGAEQRIYAYLKGEWKVMENRLVTEVTEGPIVAFETDKNTEAELPGSVALERLIGPQSRKLVSVDKDNAVFDTGSMDEVWKRISGDEFAKELQRFRAAQKKQ